MAADIRSMEWYERQYGEDWAEIVREEDIRLGRNSDGTYPQPTTAELRKIKQPCESWAAHPINMQ